MAVAATMVWEIRSTATAGNVNGGGFKPGATGTDYSQQNAAQYNLTGIASSGAGNVVLSALAAANMVGNIAHVISGTNFTAGWFEITSVSVGVSITFSTNKAGAAICTGVGASGVINIGGALSLGDASDDAAFENGVAGNTFWIKNGTYTLGTTVSISSAFGNRADAITVQGYKTTRGEVLAVADFPTIDVGAAVFSTGEFWKMKYLYFTGTGNPYLVNLGAFTKMSYCKLKNTGALLAAVWTSGGSLLYGCDVQGGAGAASAVRAGSYASIEGNYIHDTAIGITMDTGFNITVIGNIISNCATCGLDFSSSNDAGSQVYGNTFYGAETPAGIGLRVIAASYRISITNNIFYGWTAALSCVSQTTVHYVDYNNFYNNTTDATNIAKGPNDQAINPSFVNAGLANWAVGGALKGLGAPAAFLGTTTVSYPDIGAVQRQEATSTDPGIANVRSGQGYAINGSSLTGTAAIPTAANTKTGVAVDATTGTYDGSDRWTDPTEACVKTGTPYKANSTTNNKTGTYDGSDRWTDPGISHVELGVTYKANSTSNNRTGTYTPVAADYPDEADVRDGIEYSNGGFIGELDLPNASDVRAGVTFDSATETGTLAVGHDEVTVDLTEDTLTVEVSE